MLPSVFCFPRTSALLAALLVGPTACGQMITDTGTDRIIRPYSIDRNFIEAQTATVGGVTAWYADTTEKTFTNRHGTQISHMAADGTVFLVYPGNARVLRGQWEARQTPQRRQICFRYPGASPAEGEVLDAEGWRCDPARLSVYMTDQLVDGDPLRLADRDALDPPIAPAEDISLEDYAEALGLPRPSLENRIRWEWRSPF